MSDKCNREDVEQAMASGQWRKTAGYLAYEMIQAHEHVADAIKLFTISQQGQSATAHKLSRGVFWLTCAIAAAAILQGLQAFPTLWGFLFPSSGTP